MATRLEFAAALAAVVLASVAGPASAQPETSSDEIVVTGERLRELTQAYADAIAVAPTSADQYARWNFRLCPSVAGTAAGDAQALIDHIARRAHEVGVDTERAGCQPNLVIVFTSDSDHLAREIVTSRRDLLGYYGADDVVTEGREALEAFADTPRAVRWWHVSRTTTADGQQLGDSRSRGGRGTNDAVAAAQGSMGAAATTGSGFAGVESVRSTGTRTRRNTRQDLSFALVIVDSRRTAGQPSQAVADYLAMATLVQLDPDADMSAFPSILNLFAQRPPGQPAPTAMTEWDRAYLQGLYGAQREAASARAQRSEIARRMAGEVAAN